MSDTPPFYGFKEFGTCLVWRLRCNMFLRLPQQTYDTALTVYDFLKDGTRLESHGKREGGVPTSTKLKVLGFHRKIGC